MPLESVTGFSFCWYIDKDCDLNYVKQAIERHRENGGPVRVYLMT